MYCTVIESRRGRRKSEFESRMHFVTFCFESLAYTVNSKVVYYYYTTLDPLIMDGVAICLHIIICHLHNSIHAQHWTPVHYWCDASRRDNTSRTQFQRL